ncbi:hypothetical protein DDI_1771 [Dickeya dianthicola RNS04.9]|nr:hypothetical protein DDI_1771 [Dickeya dianthicola RNS04.9]
MCMNKKTINVKSGADFIKKIRVNDGVSVLQEKKKNYRRRLS